MLFVLPLIFSEEHPRAFAPSEQESLEEFLARARAKQAEVFARLSAELEGIVKRFEALSLPPPRQAREALIEECVALGSEATPLFVRWLDAGDASLEKERFRASQIAQAMMRMDTRAATTELLVLAAKGSPETRLLAVRVLETTPEPERVRPQLLQAFKTSEGQLRAALLRTLLRLASTDATLLDDVLTGEDEALCNVALGVLTDTKNAGAEERVHKLLSDAERGVSHAQQILMYYQALPELVTNVQLKELLGLASMSRVPAATRASIIDALPTFVTSSSNELKKALEPIVTGPDLKLAEAARIVMARLGDRPAKRDLLKPYDDLVESTPKWSQAYARRGDIERRIGEYRDAEKDYKKALALGAAEASSQPDTYIGLAKCAALQGNFKEAKTWLEKAPINITQLKAYASDPDFAKLRASKFGDVFPPEGR
ncbi:MAG TPA: tetratricopeptide repeat protein [Planctomycetota bacterium]|nr:tetratricopeptide repeat protein [Planctomycetota bacterium]